MPSSLRIVLSPRFEGKSGLANPSRYRTGSGSDRTQPSPAISDSLNSDATVGWWAFKWFLVLISVVPHFESGRYRSIKWAQEGNRKDETVSSQTISSSNERSPRTRAPKDNWLGFVGDVLKFTGEVRFKSMLRIDGHFSGNVNSSDGTLIISTGAEVTHAVINVAVAKINGTVEGDINASKELVLGRTASVTGKVSAPAIIVEEGALFNGTCRRI